MAHKNVINFIYKMKEERGAQGFRSGSLCGPATGGWMPTQRNKDGGRN